MFLEWFGLACPIPCLLQELECTAFEKTDGVVFKDLYQKWFGVTLSFTTSSPSLFQERFSVLYCLMFTPLFQFIVTI